MVLIVTECFSGSKYILNQSQRRTSNGNVKIKLVHSLPLGHGTLKRSALNEKLHQ